MNAMSELGRSPSELEMLVEWEASTTGQAFFSAGLDSASHTVRVTGGGLWTAADAKRYYEDQRRVVAEARRRFGKLKVFFDVRLWVVEGPHSATQFQEVNRLLYTSADRLVAVVASSIYKQYPRTALEAGNPESFVSIRAAEIWLQAYSEDRLAS